MDPDYQFFEENQSGFLVTDDKAIIVKCNKTFKAWLGLDAAAIVGKKLNEFLRVGSKIYFETHLFPLLKMQGYFEEVVIEIQPSTGEKLMVLVNANAYTEADKPTFIHYTFSRAVHRLQYEQNLYEAKTTSEKHLLEARESVTTREQLIAVLAHDLRNPLNAISMATQLIASSQDLGRKPGAVTDLKAKQSSHVGTHQQHYRLCQDPVGRRHRAG